MFTFRKVSVFKRIVLVLHSESEQDEKSRGRAAEGCCGGVIVKEVIMSIFDGVFMRGVKYLHRAFSSLKV